MGIASCEQIARLCHEKSRQQKFARGSRASEIQTRARQTRARQTRARQTRARQKRARQKRARQKRGRPTHRRRAHKRQTSHPRQRGSHCIIQHQHHSSTPKHPTHTIGLKIRAAAPTVAHAIAHLGFYPNHFEEISAGQRFSPPFRRAKRASSTSPVPAEQDP